MWREALLFNEDVAPLKTWKQGTIDKTTQVECRGAKLIAVVDADQCYRNLASEFIPVDAASRPNRKAPDEY
jgi:hypothetical protein